MAIVNCKECNKEISTQAASCPHCGFVKPKDTQSLSWLMGWVFIIVFALYYFGSHSSKTPVQPVSNTQEALPAATPSIDNYWQFETDKDMVSGKEIKSLYIKSNNSTELNFPYKGGTFSYFALVNHPRFGQSAIVQVNKGQLDCEYDNCYVSIRIDDGPVKKFYVSTPTDRSNNTYFITKHKEIIKKLQTAKKMYIELTFFQQGSYTFEYNVQDLDIQKLQ